MTIVLLGEQCTCTLFLSPVMYNTLRTRIPGVGLKISHSRFKINHIINNQGIEEANYLNKLVISWPTKTPAHST